MKENGELIQFLREKDYVMENNSLGNGSFGKTVLIRDPVIDELFVAKKYEPEYKELQEAFYNSFKQEIKILHKLNHKNLVRIYSYYCYDSVFTGYIIMEYIRGQRLDDWMNNYPPFDPKSLNEVFIQLIDAFDYLEKNAIVHRDIREGNILIDNNGIPKIIDFGLGKIFTQTTDSNDSLASQINRIGLEALPNEYFLHKYSSKTDMFYLGELFHRLIKQNSLDNCFSYMQVIEKMMNKEPERRYKSFSEIKEIIQYNNFSEFNIPESDKEIYQQFSENLLYAISAFSEKPKFNTDITNIEIGLKSLLKNNLFEQVIVKNNDLISVFVKTGYSYHPQRQIDVEIVKRFHKWFLSLENKNKEVVLNNLNYKLSTIQISFSPSFSEDIPF